MKQCLSLLLAAALVALPLPTQANEGKDQDRLENCGAVLGEILNIPDDIPSNLLNKAECVIVIPSVLKLAVGFSGSYGRGAMTCRTNKVKLGADAAAAAGPKGRDATAATDVTMRAEILTYSRSRGLFAGVSLEGSSLRQDKGPNEKIYGRKIDARDIVRKGAVAVPPSGQKLVALLNQKSPKNESDPNSLK